MAFTTTAILSYAAIAATAVSTYQTYRSNKAMAREAEAAADYNARVKEAEAAQVDAESREQIRRDRAAARRFASSQRARYAASGVLTSLGSPLEVLAYDAGQMELQSLERARAAEAYRRRGKAEAVGIRMEGASAAKGYRRAATGSLLSGAARIAGGASGFYNQGAFS